MRYPSFPESDRTSAIYDALVEDIAWREQESKPAHGGLLLDPYSQRLGSMCVAITNGLSLQERTYEPRPEEATPAQAMLERLHAMVALRREPAKAARYQRRLHENALGALRSVWQPENRQRRGFIAEYACLALLTRYTHPRILAYPALPHHEMDDDTGGHFDIGVIIDEPNTGIDTHYLQVKMTCFGSCGQGSVKNRENWLAEVRGVYRPSIQLVAGCCDLGLRKLRHNGAELPDLLLDEYRGRSKAAVKKLDNMTDKLLFAMSADLLPRGTRGGRSISLTANDFLSLR